MDEAVRRREAETGELVRCRRLCLKRGEMF